MKVILPRRFAEQIKNSAKDSFPREDYVVLIGSVKRDDVYTVKELYFPEDRVEFATEFWVNPQDHWWKEARKIAKQLGLSVLGDIHSHCFDETKQKPGLRCSLREICVPSAADMDRSMGIWELTRPVLPLFGICGVRKVGKKVRSGVYFWPASPKVDVVAV